MVKAPKKQSKRLSCHKKYKIIKKVNEHNKKVRRADKKKLKSKFKPKDPGIPNSYPFKEELLKQIKEKREKEAEAKQKVKDNRVKKASRKRKLQDLKRDAEKRTKEFEKKQSLEAKPNFQSLKTGHVEQSRKSFYKEFKKVVDAADVVIQVLDARDPLGCRCPQIEELIMSSGQNKRLILLLNKIDLIPRKVTESWLKYLRNEFPTIAFKASTQTQRDKLAQSKVNVDVASSDLLKTSTCLGAGTLLKLLGNYCRHQDVKTMITVGVVGFPNVGKSSVINSLKRSKACSVGSTPGITKNMQEIQLDKHVKLLDSPGVVMATGSSDTQVILRNAVKVEQLVDPTEPVEALLGRCNKHQIMEKYCVADYRNGTEFLALLASRLGKLKKGGIPDTKTAAKVVLQDWNSGKISFYTHPPKHVKDAEHDSVQVVQYLGAGFDLKQIEKEESDDLNELLDTLSSALVIDPGKPGQMETDDENKEQDCVEDEMQSDDDESDDDDDLNESGQFDDGNTVVVKEDMSGVVETENVEIVKKKKVDKQSSKADKDESNSVAYGNNVQLNRNNKKAFKQKQKQERKKVAKMLAEDANRMVVDNQMVDDTDDKYDFSAVFTS